MNKLGQQATIDVKSVLAGFISEDIPHELRVRIEIFQTKLEQRLQKVKE